MPYPVGDQKKCENDRITDLTWPIHVLKVTISQTEFICRTGKMYLSSHTGLKIYLLGVVLLYVLFKCMCPYVTKHHRHRAVPSSTHPFSEIHHYLRLLLKTSVYLPFINFTYSALKGLKYFFKHLGELALCGFRLSSLSSSNSLMLTSELCVGHTICCRIRFL